jgi:hypothetical protein
VLSGLVGVIQVVGETSFGRLDGVFGLEIFHLRTRGSVVKIHDILDATLMYYCMTP